VAAGTAGPHRGEAPAGREGSSGGCGRKKQTKG